MSAQPYPPPADLSTLASADCIFTTPARAVRPWFSSPVAVRTLSSKTVGIKVMVWAHVDC
jgi:hypothetical protein